MRCFGVDKVGAGSRQKQAFASLRLSGALKYYLHIKDQDWPNTFEIAARRSNGYLLVVSKVKPIDAFVRADADAGIVFCCECALIGPALLDRTR